MPIIYTIIRVMTAVVAPLTTLFLAFRTVKLSTTDSSGSDNEQNTCLRCGLTRKGAEAIFHYTESMGNPRQKVARMQLQWEDRLILGEETHFVCNHCAHRYIRNELIQQILVILPYPVYLYIYIPFLTGPTVSGNFLVETLLLVLSLTGLASAFDLYRAVRSENGPLTEVRDRVAIKMRKNEIGKKFNYFTRGGTTNLGR